MKKMFIYTYLILFTHLISANSTPANYNNSNSEKNTIIISGENLLEDESLFYTPINFSTFGLTCFFNHRYNNPKYIEDFLPNNLDDIIQFIQYAKTSGQNRAFIKTIFKIFTKKIKYSNYISSKELLNMANKLPELLGAYLMPDIQHTSDEYVIKDILCTEFADNFAHFKKDPNNFLSKVSQKICSALADKEKPEEKDITSTELRTILISFLENAFNKCLFNLNDEHQDVWEQYKELSQAAYNLKSIIFELDELNDLINSILARFNYIIDMVGSDISLQTYKNAIEELQTKNFDWLEIEEHDTLMKPKKDELLYTLKHVGFTKALARNQFGFTDAG
ncbi:MAG: hypothetical protein P4L22_02980 [Candidatus Babeliales bacterium]|nr:hypothetical protein [Candidatus Babeliales bacterium]